MWMHRSPPQRFPASDDRLLRPGSSATCCGVEMIWILGIHRSQQQYASTMALSEDGVRCGPLCYAARGFSLHAATHIPATERERLEHLCRYVACPPVAAGRLRLVDSQTLVLALKRRWDDGTTSLLLSPHELIEKLAALVPPPRLNLIRYHGITRKPRPGDS